MVNITDYAAQVGGMVMAILFAVGLGNRLNEMRQESLLNKIALENKQNEYEHVRQRLELKNLMINEAPPD